MLVRPFSLLNNSAAVYIDFLHIFHINSGGRKQHIKKRLLIANFIYDIHISSTFSNITRTFNNFVMCSIFVVSYILEFFFAFIGLI